MVYRFRVTYEDHEDVYRDIELKSTQSFHDLHLAIQQSIGFDNSKDASFFTSDDYWRKEEEIPVVSKTGLIKKKINKAVHSLTQEAATKKVGISEYISDPHQKFVYVSDPEKEWTFHIELIKIVPDETGAKYPKCIKTVGNSPKQYKDTNLPIPPVEEDEGFKNPKEDLDSITEDLLMDESKSVEDTEELQEGNEEDIQASENEETEEGAEEDPSEEESSDTEEDL